MAYTVAGAFVEFIGSTYGKASLRAWYRGQSLDAITGTSFKQLEQRFKAHLETVVLPNGALEAARARFARKGLFSRRCPHAVDRTVDAANQRLRQGDAPHACTLYERAVSLDSTEVAARFGLGDCARRSSQLTRAEDAYRKLASDANLPTLIRERADELLADLYFENQELAKAKAIYTRLAESTFEADRRRSLELKAHADSPAAVTALRSLLIGEHGEKAWDLAVRDLLLWSEAAPSSGIADYLLGRNFWLQGREAAAVQHLDRALAKSIEPPDIKAEALRLRAVIACALHDKTTAIALADKVAHESQLLTPRRLGLLRLVERCAGRPLDDDWPETRDPTQVVTVSAATSTKTPHDGSHAAKTGKLVWNSESFTCPSGMVKIPGDVFWMGSIRGRNSDDETPRFQTEVAGFCLDETEVTVAAYRECVERGDCRPVTADNKTCNFEHDDRRLHPINCVDYEQAQTFCAKRQARLPTEIEWEYAARGGTRELKYPWGDASPDGHACWKTYMSCPVKTYAAGAFGLFDMSGNVWEWTSSDYAPYPFVPPDGENQQKVYRGGSWSRRFEKWMHLGLRNRWKPHDSGSHLGFRCAKSASELGCPGSVGADGQCLRTVLNADCPFGEKWNGYRCAPPNAPLCEDGDHADRDHGCIRDIPIVIQEQPADTQSVHRSRSPEFDADCRTNQPSRPRAYRYFGGDHLARNLVEKQSGCKNRDVGAGWNSACCP
jgi:formylglycine-generating enzyme required for sulfatase activity